jgi:hypothetical protein
LFAHYCYHYYHHHLHFPEVTLLTTRLLTYLGKDLEEYQNRDQQNALVKNPKANCQDSHDGYEGGHFGGVGS